MRVLLDHCVPKRTRQLLPGHVVRTTGEMGWETLKNGQLLRAAAAAPFDVLLTIDKKMRYEQNPVAIPLPVVILDIRSNAYASIVPFAPGVQSLLSGPLARGIHFVAADGTVTRFGGP